jgi:hypothetical protein
MAPAGTFDPVSGSKLALSVLSISKCHGWSKNTFIGQSGHNANTWIGKQRLPGSFQVPMDTVPLLTHWDPSAWAAAMSKLHTVNRPVRRRRGERA